MKRTNKVYKDKHVLLNSKKKQFVEFTLKAAAYAA